MDIDKILQKFGVFSGLSGDALTASSLPHIGAAALVNRHTLAAAKALCEEYLAAAAEYIASGKFTFRQVRS